MFSILKRIKKDRAMYALTTIFGDDFAQNNRCRR